MRARVIDVNSRSRSSKSGSEVTSKNEKMMQPTNSHLPVLYGMLTQPNCWQLLKISLDQEVVVNMVIAVKISDT